MDTQTRTTALTLSGAHYYAEVIARYVPAQIGWDWTRNVRTIEITPPVGPAITVYTTEAARHYFEFFAAQSR